MRKTSGTIICPSCKRLIDVREPRCPYCNMPRPGLWGFAPLLQRVAGGAGDMSRLITVVCVALYVVALLADPRAMFAGRGLLNLLSPNGRVLYVLGMTGGPAWDARWWTVVSAIYLHGSLLHIVFNMLWIRQLGPMVEHVYGTGRFLIIFTVAGVAGFLVSNIFSGAFTIGASGSIFGLLGALIVYGRKSGTHVMTRQLIVLAAMVFAFGFMMSAVNNWAHAGGFAGGWLAATFLGAGVGPREGTRERLLGLACLAGSLLIMAGRTVLLAIAVALRWMR